MFYKILMNFKFEITLNITKFDLQNHNTIKCKLNKSKFKHVFLNNLIIQKYIFNANFNYIICF